MPALACSLLQWTVLCGNDSSVGRVSPEPFQVIVILGLLIKDMDNEIPIVQEYPFRFLITFPVVGPNLRRSQSFLYPIGDRVHLALRGGTTNQKSVRIRGDAPQIQ
jgi:hypothetical protein